MYHKMVLGDIQVTYLRVGQRILNWPYKLNTMGELRKNLGMCLLLVGFVFFLPHCSDAEYPKETWFGIPFVYGTVIWLVGMLGGAWLLGAFKD